VLRRILRLVDDSAKAHGLESVEHKALIQIVGARADDISVGDIAERLYISATFASRLIKVLLSKKFVKTQLSKLDQRVVHITATQAGIALLAGIESDVRMHVDYFIKQLSEEQKRSAIAMFAFYIGTNIRIVGHGPGMDAPLVDHLD
jgi:DNA-binding MarR family transcriptional regulator